MFDVFYTGIKPNLFAHEQACESVQHAQQLSRTRYCWIVDYLTDYTGFDFLFEPRAWEREYTHVWPSQWHAYSGTYLIPKTGPIQYLFSEKKLSFRENPQSFRELIPGIKFDRSWRPHPLDPPMIYVFGNQWHSAEKMPTVEYHVPGAVQRKFMSYPRAQLRPCAAAWSVPPDIDMADIDFSWVPDPGSPPYIYQFATQHQRTGGQGSWRLCCHP
jgi:hypothetical protein